MEFLLHNVSAMSVQKFHSPYFIRKNNIKIHFVPLFPFTHFTHAIISKIGKEQKCAGLQSNHRPA